MNDIMGIIFASDNETKLNELTLHRTTASLPFCGRKKRMNVHTAQFVNFHINKFGTNTQGK